MRFSIKSFILCLAFFLSLPIVGIAKKDTDSRYITSVTPVSGVAAVVNGEMISLHDLQRQSMPEIMRARISKGDPQAEAKIATIQRKILDNMITDLLLSQEAARLGITTSDAVVEAEIEKILKSNKIDLITLERSLAAQGLDLEYLKGRIRSNSTNSKLMQAMVTHKVVVSDEDIEKYYNEHKSQFVKDKTVNLQVIVFSPQTHADVPSIIKQIKSGAMSFEKAAQTYSIGPKANEGGTLGLLEWEDLPPVWREALQGVKAGEITSVFKMDEAEAVLKLQAEQSGMAKTFDEAALEVERILKEPLLQERFKEYVQQQHNKAVIDIRY